LGAGPRERDPVPTKRTILACELKEKGHRRITEGITKESRTEKFRTQDGKCQRAESNKAKGPVEGEVVEKRAAEEQEKKMPPKEQSEGTWSKRTI